MPKKTYVGVNNKAKEVPSKGYIGIGNKAKKLIKGYVGDDNGKAQLFWGGIEGFVIFDDGVFYNVPQGMSINNYVETEITVDDLKEYWFTSKCLWVNKYPQNPDPWKVEDKILKSGFGSEIFIPIIRIYKASKIRFTYKTNSNPRNSGLYSAIIYPNSQPWKTFGMYFENSNDWREVEWDLSNDVQSNPNKIIDYIDFWVAMYAYNLNDYLWIKKIEIIGGYDNKWKYEEQFKYEAGKYYRVTVTSIVGTIQYIIDEFCKFADNSGVCIQNIRRHENTIIYTLLQTAQGYENGNIGFTISAIKIYDTQHPYPDGVWGQVHCGISCNPTAQNRGRKVLAHGERYGYDFYTLQTDGVLRTTKYQEIYLRYNGTIDINEPYTYNGSEGGYTGVATGKSLDPYDNVTEYTMSATNIGIILTQNF